MTIAAFLAVCGAGSVLGFASRSHRGSYKLIGVGFAGAAALLSLLLASARPLSVGGVSLATTPYSSYFLAATAAACFLLGLVALATDWSDRLIPAALGAFAALTIALTSGDGSVALVAAAGATACGAIVTLHRFAGTMVGPDGRVSEMRTLGLLTAALLFAGLVLVRPSWTPSDERPLVAAFALLALALAVRSGSVPFHIPAARLGRNSSPMAAALVLVWLPAAVGLVALTWAPATFRIHQQWMDLTVTAIQAVAVATLVLGGLAAVFHDEIDEIAAYSMVADSGFVLLALAARTDAVAEPARLWLVAFVLAKTALVAWVAAAAHVFGSNRLGGLRGWLRRAPLMALALVVIVVANLGWPGSATYEARSSLIRLGLPSGYGFLFGVAIVLAVAWVARLLLVGVMTPVDTVRAAVGEGLRWPRSPESTAAEPPALPPDGPIKPTIEPVERPESPPVWAPAEIADAEGTPASHAPQGSKPPPPTAAPPSQEEAPESSDASGVALEQAPQPKGRRKRGSRSVAATNLPPTISAPVPGAAEPTGRAAEPTDDAEPAPASAAPAPGATPAEPARAPGATPAAATPAPGATEPARAPDAAPGAAPKPALPLSRRLAAAWRLNRTLETSFLLAASALLAVAVSAGSLGASYAAQWGLPLGTAAHATPSPTSLPTLAPTQGPIATGTPVITAPPTSSAPPTPPSSPTPKRSVAPGSPKVE